MCGAYRLPRPPGYRVLTFIVITAFVTMRKYIRQGRCIRQVEGVPVFEQMDNVVTVCSVCACNGAYSLRWGSHQIRTPDGLQGTLIKDY